MSFTSTSQMIGWENWAFAPCSQVIGWEHCLRNDL